MHDEMGRPCAIPANADRKVRHLSEKIENLGNASRTSCIRYNPLYGLRSGLRLHFFRALSLDRKKCKLRIFCSTFYSLQQYAFSAPLSSFPCSFLLFFTLFTHFLHRFQVIIRPGSTFSSKMNKASLVGGADSTALLMSISKPVFS